MGRIPSLYSFASVNELAPALRTYVLACQDAGIAHHDSFRVAVSGGSLPETLAQALLSSKDGLVFDKWDIFFADERAVPLDHDDSNYKGLKDALLDKIPEGWGKPGVHTIDTAALDDTQELADRYEAELIKTFAAKDSVKLPTFDLLLLGSGPDGHTCSLFPGHPLLRETVGWILSIDDSPKPPPKRITLSLPVVTAASKIAFVATGSGKRDVLARIFDADDGHALPCGLVNSGGGDRVSWFCDEAAASGVASVPRRHAGSL